jgi:ribosomal protein S18 acetylase RimI-like enzyme
VRVRAARAADVGAILAIEDEAFRTDRLTRRKLVRLLSRGNCALLVVVARREVAGYALVLFRRGAASARLYGIAVRAPDRGRGLGRRLLRAAEAVARRRGAARITLETDPSNEAAVRLYRSHGFRLVRRLGPYYEDSSPADRWSKGL